MSSYESTAQQSQDQIRCQGILEGKKLIFESIDGALEENKEKRNELFGISDKRGKYPQVFIKGEDGNIQFIGLWENIEVTVALPDLASC